MRQSLGTAVFAGMLGVTAFGLLFTPVFYVVARFLAGKGGVATGDVKLPAQPSAEGHATALTAATPAPPKS